MSPASERSSDLPIVANKFPPTANVKPARGHRALRLWRTSIPDRTYFITVCTHARQHLLQTTAVADVVFEHLLALEKDQHVIDLVASVVMPDHVHAVFTLRSEGLTLATVLKRFRGACAQTINRALGRHGPVWQRGYFDRLLRVDDRLQEVLSYLWHNPTPAGLHFRCRKEIWEWFRACVNDKAEYHDWLKQNP